jgi:hypothetical protein
MEAQLQSLTYTTPHPEELQRFLSVVLGLEITPLSEGLFRVELGSVSVDVSAGPENSCKVKFRITLSLENFEDLAARWEFFHFRAASRHRASFKPQLVSFELSDGSLWYVTPVIRSFADENPTNLVRNC